MKQLSAQLLKKRKFLLVFPVLFLPFSTLAFWAMGGGTVTAKGQQSQQGLNNKLPEAHLSNQALDKMSLYKKAEVDSENYRRQLAFGSHGSMDTTTMLADTILPLSPSAGTGTLTSPGWIKSEDPNEQKVRERLKRLEAAINQPPEPAQPTGNLSVSNSEDVRRLEDMMKTVEASPGQDAEMQQLSGVLEKILDIQTPGRAEQKLRELSAKNRGRVYPVNKPLVETNADYFSNGSTPYNARLVDSGAVPVFAPLSESNGFYDLQTVGVTDEEQTATAAVIHGTQTLISGSTVKMRLLEDIMVSGTMIPKGSFLYGNCTINGERLKIDIPGLRYHKSLYPVALSVYALDALEGIPIPGALTRDAAKEGMDRTAQSIQFMSMDPSVATQAAGAGVEVAKGLFGKKAKLVRVTVKADYPILLMDAKTRQEAQ